jgi:hypothetical protein
MAVNVTGCPAQMLVADALMLTEGSTVDPTDIIMAFEVAPDGLAQFNEEIISAITSSPGARLEF